MSNNRDLADLGKSAEAIDVDASAPADSVNIDSSGNVGIGTTSPTNLLTLNATTPSIDLLSGGTGKVSILTGSGGNLAFYTGGVYGGTGSERMRILSSGGITFNGDSASANALDDYEEGTWTPVLDGSYGNTPASIASGGSMSGTYTKIGNVVTCTIVVDFNSSLSISTDDRFKITGLPFANGISSWSGLGTGFSYGVISSGNNAMWTVASGSTSGELWMYCNHVDGSLTYGTNFKSHFTYKVS